MLENYTVDELMILQRQALTEGDFDYCELIERELEKRGEIYE